MAISRKPPRVSMIILNWNGREVLKECLASLEEVNYPNFEVILVDNGSTDGSVEEIKNLKFKIKNLILIENKKNLGFAKANNQGFEKAKGEYILFLNNDTKVNFDFLKKLVEVLDSDEKIGVVQPKIIFMDSGKLQAGGAFLTNTGFLYHYGLEKHPENEKYNHQMEIFSANGSCMLVKREVIGKVGLFDPDFFCYFEETDFCWRVWLAGYEIVYVPEAVIYHKRGKTARRFKSNFIQQHSFKNRICSLIKNLGWFELLKILPSHLLFCQLATLGLLITGEFSNAWAIQKAIGWNFLRLGRTLEKRRKIQGKVRKISDKELMPKIKRSVRPSYYYYLFTGLGKYGD